MRVIAYRTTKFMNVSVYQTDYILSQNEPDVMSEEDRENARNGIIPMCCFKDKESGTLHFIPWEFVIKIEDQSNDKAPW